jgi:putative ABC transport system permease protein
VSLALSTLIYEWRRYMAAVIALALSGVLILSQVGMFIGISKAVTAYLDRAGAEIIFLGPDAKNLSNSGGVPKRLQPAIYMHPEITDLRPLIGNGGRWINDPDEGEDRKDTFVSLWGIDTYVGSPTLPTDFSDDIRLALQEPFTVVIDETAQGALGATAGDTVTLNGRAVKVVALISNYPNVIDTEAFTSVDTMRMLGLGGANNSQNVMMARIRDPERAEQVRDELNAVADGMYRAWTNEELAKANEALVFEEQIVGILLGFTVLLGFGIGIGITSMTLRGAIMANIKELASFRALGVSMGSLRMIVLELSFWVGVIGCALAGLLVWGVSALAQSRGVVMAYPPSAVIGTMVLLMIIAMASGVISLGVLKRSQPADLLR